MCVKIEINKTQKQAKKKKHSKSIFHLNKSASNLHPLTIHFHFKKSSFPFQFLFSSANFSPARNASFQLSTQATCIHIPELN